MIPSLEGLPTKAEGAPSPHEGRLAPLDSNPVFHSLGERFIGKIFGTKTRLDAALCSTAKDHVV